MNVLHRERVLGAQAAPEAAPTLLIEVPHGADEQAQYDALAARLLSPLPDHLERFFHVNTDVGAWALGQAIAQAWVARHPRHSVLLLRCLIPRTFVDVNRVLDEAAAGMTPGVPPYITDPADHALLRQLHADYTAQVQAAYQQVCGAGGLAVIPHTYAPRTVPITTIDADIVRELERVYQPDILATCPLRPEVDLITASPEGEALAPPGVPEALIAKLATQRVQAQQNASYSLHPSTMGAVWSRRWPGQVLCFEVRRDLVTHWEPFVPKRARLPAVERLGAAVADVLPGPA